MNERTVLAVLAGVFVLANGAATGAEPPSRRQIDMFEIDRYASFADPIASLMTTRFRLLERREAQTDLHLSEEQMVAIQDLYKTPWNDIPGLSDFIAEQKKEKQGLSEEERISQNMESSRRTMRLAADFHSKKLNEILTAPQRDRLDQLIRQTHGPVLILVQPKLQSALAMSPDQIKDLTASVREADRRIIPVLQEFGRGFISGYGPGEDEQTRERSMKELVTRLRRMIGERDDGILNALSGDQRKTWTDWQGKPLKIEWSPWDLMREPFE